jgi:uncharacterized protein (TIGR02145 family)
MKRLFLFLIVGYAVCSTALFTACKVENEEPLFFETTALAKYNVPATAASATFTISGNTAWTVEVTEGRDRCGVTPASGTGSATVTVHVDENPVYLQAQAMALRLTAGNYTKDIAVTQAAPPCPDFNAGAIAAAGQTVTMGGTPATINSTQAATGGDGNISYQWYKDGNAIAGATGTAYTPPQDAAATVGTYTYTRRAKDNTCNPTLTPAVGNWVLMVVCPDFNPGAIATAGQTLTVGGTPVTINSVQDATGSNISYQWYKNGTVINGATEAYYTPPPEDATAAGAHTYTRRANDNICNTTLTPAEGNWVLTVVCPGFDPGAIATTGQTVIMGGTPITIHSVQDATGGTISYQWYKNGTTITGATEAYYTPPPEDATVAGAHTYTRRVKDNICNPTLTLSEGMWVLTVCSDLNPGAIATDGQTVAIGGTPGTINSLQNATGNGTISYQWYKNGNTINGATEANYTPPPADATAVGAHTYTRHAKDNICHTTLTPAEGSWVLTVICPGFDPGAIATTGQTVALGGIPATIYNAQYATGNGAVSYQWYKNGQPINGATAANYTPPPADAAAAGVNTYTRRAKDNICNTTLTQSAGSWVLTVMVCDFNAGAISSAGQTICSNNAVNIITSEADASGGDNNISYQWRRNGSAISGATVTTYSPVAFNATTGAHTFTRWVHDGACKTSWTQSAGSWVLTVNGGAQITLTTANDRQYIANGAAITPIQYTTANASTVTCSDLPSGISAAWASNTLTISGNSTATGTHTYIVTATGIDGCSNAYVSGNIKIYPAGIDGYGCVPSNLTLGATGFASTVTHAVSGAYGSQTWSAPVTATYCAKTTFNGGTTDAYRSDCRSNMQATYGQLFSWCMVKQYAAQLCPSPWRAPTSEDFCTLDKILTGRSSCGTSYNNFGLIYIGEWGGVYGGQCYNSGSLVYQGSYANYWSSTEYDTNNAYYLYYNSSSSVYPQSSGIKYSGHTVRCVKD